MKIHLITLTLISLVGLARGADTPKAWFKAGSHPNEYLMKYEIVLDVPNESESVNFGLMTKSGQLWMDDLKFEEVNKSVPVTDLRAGKEVEAKEPSNLDFEESE